MCFEAYDAVRVNGVEVAGVPTIDNDREDYAASPASLEARRSVVFDNHVNENAMRTLTLTKHLYDAAGNMVDDDPALFNFRLYLGNEHEQSLSLAHQQEYYVRDSHGIYCRWDYDSQGFVPIGKDTFEDLLPEELAAVTFHTSANGAISKIPAGYKVEVRDLLVGIKFMVEERLDEIPAGYSFIEYHRDADSYIIEQGDTENAGVIRASQSPAIEVRNRKGFGLTARKVWSDASYVSSHGDIYFAVYADGTLVPGTVRQLHHPQVSTYYYFDTLVSGCSFEDYEVMEVLPEGSYTVAEDGTVSGYDSVSPVPGHISVPAVPKGQQDETAYDYFVTYERGAVAPEQDNVKTDVVYNTRLGVVIKKTAWDGVTPLQGARFVLGAQDGSPVGDGEYVSGTDGVVTQVYIDADTPCTVTEAVASSGYYGCPPVTFSRAEDGTITVSDGDDDYYDIIQPANGEPGVIVLRNRPLEFTAVKTNDAGDALEGVHFALYPMVKSSTGTLIRDYRPVPGMADIVTNADGLIAGVDETLPAGTYYLEEKQTLEGYALPDEDIIFTVTPLGEVVLENAPVQGTLSRTFAEDGTATYVLSVKNYLKRKLTVTEEVTGNMGNKTKEFVFTFVSDVPGETYTWTKDGVPQAPIASGDTFTLSHGERAVFDIPVGREVSISQDPDGYEVTFQTDGGEALPVDHATVVMDEDHVIHVVDRLDLIIPTGVKERGLWAWLAPMFLWLCLFLIWTIKRRQRFKCL